MSPLRVHTPLRHTTNLLSKSTRRQQQQYSSLSPAEQAAQTLLSTFSSPSQTTSRTQLLDANQAQKLCLTLSRPSLSPTSPSILTCPPPDGTPLPPGYHLVYFTPNGFEADLGFDGTDKTYNAPGGSKFTRRMWAGGKMEWDRGEGLKVGERVEETTRLVGAKAKKGRDGNEMVLVEVEKEYFAPGRGRVLRDMRSWIFRPEVDVGTEGGEEETKKVETNLVKGSSVREDVSVEGDPFPHRHLSWSPIGLFRFSALTFNAHKIHYDSAWACGVEGHKQGGPIVHGPLNLIQMLDYHRDLHHHHDGHGGGGKEGSSRVKDIEYRATAPLYAGQRYGIRTEEVEGGEKKKWDVFVERQGKTCVKGRISDF